jgi:hypothetical protein
VGLSLGLIVANPAIAEKAGGILKVGHFDSPASVSMLEESTLGPENRPSVDRLRTAGRLSVLFC